MLRALPLFFLALPAHGESALMAGLAGQYGSVGNPDYACATNPVQLSFTEFPPHARFSWAFPRQIFNETTATEAVYDLISEVPGGLLLRLEGEERRTASGAPVVWVLRPDSDLQGFCWGRTDWPMVQCVNPFVRCDAAPIS